jgi:RHS repeat-associated protein
MEGSDVSHRYGNWITSVQNRKTDNSTLFDMTYAYQDGTLYDSVGNPLVRTEAVDGTTYTTTYRYDAVNRQVSESRTPGAYSLSYGYDAVGNRTTRTLDGTTYTNVYDDNNKLTSASGGGLTASFGYDSNGNMTSVSGTMCTAKTMVYNDENRLTSITYSGVTDTYTYNWQGLRTRALLSGTYQRYFYDGERVLEDLNDSGGTLARYTVTDGTYQGVLLGFQRNDGSVRYPILDEIGSARRLVDGSATATDAYSLDAFGRNMSTTGSTPNPYRYGGAWGYITDPSGMLQLGARFYWPELGRFVSQDPVREGADWYAYVQGNPLTAVDPEGLTQFFIAPRDNPSPATSSDKCEEGYRQRVRECVSNFGGDRTPPDSQGPFWAALAGAVGGAWRAGGDCRQRVAGGIVGAVGAAASYLGWGHVRNFYARAKYRFCRGNASTWRSLCHGFRPGQDYGQFVA